MRLAVIGAGSTYTPELADGLGRLGAQLRVDELALMDPDTDRLAVVAGVSRRILARHGSPRQRSPRPTASKPPRTEQRRCCCRSASAARPPADRDESWPLDCGCVGQETTGAGGLAKALRTVPVVAGIAERVRAVSPAAWIVNFTNPVGIVTRALLEDGHRAVGLCNVAIGLQRYLAGLLDAVPEQVELTHVGLNHLTWELDVRLAAADGTSAARTCSSGTGADRRARRAARSLLRRLRVLPSYYLRYFYEHDLVVTQTRGRPTRAEQVAALEAELLRHVRGPGAGHQAGAARASGAARTTPRRRSGSWQRCSQRRSSSGTS